jgi:predicted TPR repeat methyltransferase
MNRNERRLAAKQSKRKKQATPGGALPSAISLHQKGQLGEAEKIYRSILARQPDNPDALHFLGVLLHQTGQSDKAIASVNQALRFNPSYLDACNNLGNIYKETGDMQKAAETYRKVIDMAPDHAGACNNLGVVLRNLGAYEESVRALLKAAELSPGNADVFQNLGNSYQEQDEYDKAAVAYQQAIAIKPHHKYAYESLWRMMLKTGQPDQAIDVLRRWIQADPENPIARHHFSACMGENIPDRASQAYIQDIFDKFAASFDTVLNRLDYRAPELVTQAVSVLFPEPRPALRILDAGCGTGLCGPLLRPYARMLVGVDLSSGMLNKARGRNLYDDLVEADLVDYLSRYEAAFDVIVSADTLVYFGELGPFLRAAARALASAGCLVFTVEKSDENSGNGFKLNPHGRYAHTHEYIKTTLTAWGFDMRAADTVVLRKEAGQPVTGLLVTATLK